MSRFVGDILRRQGLVAEVGPPSSSAANLRKNLVHPLEGLNSSRTGLRCFCINLLTDSLRMKLHFARGGRKRIVLGRGDGVAFF